MFLCCLPLNNEAIFSVENITIFSIVNLNLSKLKSKTYSANFKFMLFKIVEYKMKYFNRAIFFMK